LQGFPKKGFEELEERVKDQIRKHLPGYAIGSLGWVFFAVFLWNDYVLFGPEFLRYVFTREEFLRHLLAFLIIPAAMFMGYLYESMREEAPEVSAADRREVEERYRSIVEDSGDAILTLDREGKITSYNKAASKLFGYSREEVLGNCLSPLVTSEGVSELEEVLRKVGEGEIPESHAGHITTKDGGTVDIFMTVSPLRSAGGEIVGAACMIKDMTGKRMPEEDTSKKHLEVVQDTLTEQISVIDKDLRILSFNRAFAEAADYPEEEMVGERCYRIIHGYDEKEFETLCKDRCLVRKAFETGNLVEDTHKHGEEGKEVYHEVRALPSKDEKGNVSQVVYIVRDVTARKKVEEELIKYSGELEQSSKLKELLLDILSHDLINPLTVIKTASEFLEEEEGLGGKEEVKIIADSAATLERIIKDAMICARLESYEALSFEEDDLVQLLKDVIYEYRDAAEERGIEVVLEGEKECPAEVTPFVSDAFSNLLSNALKFSPPDSRVIISAEDGGEVWKVTFKDNGEGVPDEYKKAIFERFKRVDRFGGAKGTGLGLAIVERIVKMHGGKVWVEDNPEGGSIFCVEIPKSHLFV